MIKSLIEGKIFKQTKYLKPHEYIVLDYAQYYAVLKHISEIGFVQSFGKAKYSYLRNDDGYVYWCARPCLNRQKEEIFNGKDSQ
jgi:hypothetical protein